MRLVILTSARCGVASQCLPALCGRPSLDVAAVILTRGHSSNRKSLRWRKLKKILRIGPLGALNAVRIRPWFRDTGIDDIAAVCSRHGVRLLESDFINCERTRELFLETRAHLGLSLGNGFIAHSVFSIPRYGMINIHKEILPRFQGAQSIIWPIHDGVKETGFTIHQIDDHIDTGEILYQRVLPLEFCRRLEDTVRVNCRRVAESVPAVMAQVCENYEALRSAARPQDRGRSYTTPSLWQFLRMVRNNRRFFREQERSRATTIPPTGGASRAL
jgi:methionyl-tRNA formyltransferase